MNMKNVLWMLFILIFLPRGVMGEEEIVDKITVLGNVKIEEAVIRGAIKTQEGQKLSLEQVKDDLKSILNLGYFTDVQVDVKPTPKGKEVIFIVMEKPSIKDIKIIGT